MNRLPFFVQTPWVGAVGNMSEEMYYALLRARRENRKVLFLFPYDLFKPFVFSKFGLGINSELKKIESVYRFGKYNNPFIIFLNIILTLACSILILIDVTIGKFVNFPRWFRVPQIGKELLWRRNKKEKYSYERVRKWNWGHELQTYLEINLPKKSLLRAKEIRLKMGLPEDAWFVCLHNREGGYYSQAKGYKEGQVKVIRNADIKNYIKAIKYITKNGGWVVRIGDQNMTKLPKMKNVIDYPFTEYKSDLMDIYLLKECNFFIGPRSGIAETAIMFQKPAVFVNWIAELNFLPWLSGSLVIYKHIFHNKLDRFLSLKDMLHFTLYRDSYMDTSTNTYDLIENSEEEIYCVVKEFLNNKNKGVRYTDGSKIWIKKCVENSIAVYNKFDDTRIPDTLKFRESPTLFGGGGTVGSKFYKDFYNTALQDKSRTLDPKEGVVL